MLRQNYHIQKPIAGNKPVGIFVSETSWFIECLTNNDVLSLSSSYHAELIAGRHQSLLV